MADALPIKKDLVLDLLDSKSPALSSTSDMPVVETKPDASPPKEEATKDEAVPPAEEAGEAEQSGESATPATEGTPGQPAEQKPARGVGKKIQELTKRAEEAERKAREAEENLTRTLKAIEDGRMHEPKSDDKPEVETDPEPARPNKADFSDPEAWDAAVIQYADEKAAWTARREVKAAREADEKQRFERAQAEAQKATQEAFQARVDKTVEKYPDFHEVAESPDVKITMAMAHAIVNHEQGPELQYHLGKHPEEAKRISALPIAAQLVELGVIAAGFRNQAAPVAEAAAPAKPITSAPAPIKPVTQGTGTVAKDPSEMSMDEYAAFRKPQLQGERRPGRR